MTARAMPTAVPEPRILPEPRESFFLKNECQSPCQQGCAAQATRPSVLLQFAGERSPRPHPPIQRARQSPVRPPGVCPAILMLPKAPEALPSGQRAVLYAKGKGTAFCPNTRPTPGCAVVLSEPLERATAHPAPGVRGWRPPSLLNGPVAGRGGVKHCQLTPAANAALCVSFGRIYGPR